MAASPKHQPFSKLKPAEKFARKFAELHPDIWEHVEAEFVFHQDRGWRIDFAWPSVAVAVEIDGFGWGHQAQQRISDNNEKANTATRMGWSVFRFDSRLLGSHRQAEDAVDLVAKHICTMEP